MKSKAIGDLTQLADQPFFEAVAEGLELIYQNASRYWEGMNCLVDSSHPRGARVLEALCEEEAAKCLILIDAVRCPRQPSGVFARQLAKFNEHLAKAIYTDACDWRPADFSEIERHVLLECQQHYLDGPNDVDWIFDNSLLREREQAIYVDLVESDGEHNWISPLTFDEVVSPMLLSRKPTPLQIAHCLRSIGGFSVQGLSTLADLWRPTVIESSTKFAEVRALACETINALAELKEREIDMDHAGQIVKSNWPFPMHSLEMKRIKNSKADLDEIRQRWVPE